MARGRGRKKQPDRSRRRTSETLAERPVRVAIATAPDTSSGRSASMQNDTDLVKAALLYADEVEVVGLSVAMFGGLAKAMEGPAGGMGLLAVLDDDLIERLTEPGSLVSRPSIWRPQLEALLSAPKQRVARLSATRAEEYWALRESLREASRPLEENLRQLLEEEGATELMAAIQAGAVNIPDLGYTPSDVMRPTITGREGRDRTDAQIGNWISTLIERLNDPSVRLLFDGQSGRLIQSMVEAGLLQQPDRGFRLAAQASLGAGFLARLPAFPMAKMDELLDFRKQFQVPLARYRGKIIEFSDSIPAVIGDGLDFEVEELWERTVRPEFLALEEQMADHSFVRELARSVGANDVRDFGTWTATTIIGVTGAAAIDLMATGLAASATVASARIGSHAWTAHRSSRENLQEAGRNDLFFLYQANERFRSGQRP